MRPPPAEVDDNFVGLLMAHHARRLTARNMLVAYGTNMGLPPGFGIHGTDDLYELYQDIIYLQDSMETSEGLLQLIEEKRVQATSLVECVRTEEMGEEDAQEHVRQAVILQREIAYLTGIMEDMAGA